MGLHLEVLYTLGQNFPPVFQAQLQQLLEIIRTVNQSSDAESITLVKRAIEICYEISNFGGNGSLEGYLESLHIVGPAYKNRLVYEIDKMSRYKNICKDLVRISGRAECRPLFKNIKLVRQRAFPACRPSGSLVNCHVHAEIQLIYQYDTTQAMLSPRCIGSSKSACLLCDLFIKSHGGFSITHSHRILYDKWAIPPLESMPALLRAKYMQFLKQMSAELTQLHRHYQAPPHIEGLAHPESRTHLLLMPSGRYSSASSGLPIRVNDAPMSISVASASSSCARSERDLVFQHQTYVAVDLPIKIQVTSLTISCSFQMDENDYLFDLQDIESGVLSIESSPLLPHSDEKTIDIRGRTLESPLILASNDDASLEFHLYDAGVHALRITIKWTSC